MNVFSLCEVRRLSEDCGLDASMLVSAHRIYAAAGFRLVDEAPHHSFGKDLVGQTWN